jgi:hypothetical protein
MKHLLILFVCVAAFACTLSAQTVDTSVCDVLSNPQSFEGKIVRVKGTVFAGFDEFTIKDPACKQPSSGIWLAYPEGSKAKAGPVAALQLQLAKNSAGKTAATNRVPVRLEKNKDFKQFDSLLSSPYKGSGSCIGCVRYAVSATLTGRLDSSANTGAERDANGKFVAVSGFGNMNRFRARLVLQSVSDIASQEIDYTKSAALKDDSSQDSGGGDPVAVAHQSAKAFASGSAAAAQLERGAAAYGEPGEDNGVVVGFGATAELASDDGQKGASDSPDGLILKATFDMDRLKGKALSTAITHVGTHIADIRGSKKFNEYELEYRAWQTTVFSTIAQGRKTLTLPGGLVAWNNAWPPEERGVQVDSAISKFIVEWIGIAK